MDVKTIIGFSKDDRFSQDHFRKFYDLAIDRGFEVFSSQHIPSISGIPKQEGDISNSVILAVFGGDGTMLRAQKYHHGLPTLGINCGSFGFLCEYEADQVEDAIDFLVKGEWKIETTTIIESTYDDTTYLGINECVISGADTGRPVDLRVRIDGVTMFESRGDGLIVSTPTGSTAYNIASGGAIVAPTVECMTITPIAPFLTLNRSVIVDASKEVEILNLERTRRCLVFYDGVKKHQLNPGEQFSVYASDKKIIFLRGPGSYSRRMSLKIASRFPIR